MTIHITHLTDRALSLVQGEEAASFLQGMLTCDMEKVTRLQAQAGALLSPQGKILFDVMLIQHEEGYVLETVSAKRDEFIKRLTFYKLRAKAAILPFDDFGVYALWPENNSREGFYDPRWRPLGKRAYARRDKIMPNVEEAAYHRHRIFHAIPEAEKDYVLGEAFPHEANFDILNGIDFHKGCYIGQEVVSRMQHRGKARKRILPFKIEGAAPSGTPIVAGSVTLGQLGSSSALSALGLVRLDRLEEALITKATMTAGSAKLHFIQPAWANFAIAGAAA
jgi:folate-binding protein YgfZ